MLMRLGKFSKTPAETKRYSVDYRHWLEVAEFVSSFTLQVTPPGLSIIGFAVEQNATRANFLVQGGSLNETYEVTILMTTTAGQVKEDTITFVVRRP
jgi:hypothetical protein